MKDVTMCCTTCPSGCALAVTVDGDKVVNLEGNACKRGIKFAEKELVAPERMLTSTVLVRIGGKEMLMPVKSQVPMPKEKMMDAMKEIRSAVIDHYANMGDVVISDIAGCGIDIVACRTLKA